MTKRDNPPAAIMGDFASYRPVLGRKVLQVVIEVAIERQAEVFAALGYPTGGGSIPVAVTRLNAGSANGRPSDFGSENAGSTPAPATKPERHRWSELSPTEQSGILCREADFIEFAASAAPEVWSGCPHAPVHKAAAVVRHFCGVNSRADIEPGSEAARRWNQLQIRYGSWLRQRNNAA